MGGKTRRGWLVAAACLCAALGACEQSADRSSDGPAARTPGPAPRVVLTADVRQLWARGRPDRSVVSVPLYHGLAPVGAFSKRLDADLGIDPEVFARQMVLLDHAGYETITLDEFVRFVEEGKSAFPPGRCC